MSVSFRESIRWLPDVASEPTSTIVLRSPERRFVDIRILVGDAAAAAAAVTGDLDWAFAGTSTSELRADGVRHSTWRHTVDSRTRAGEIVVDEGDMVTQDGDGGLTLETGRMVNPATGQPTDYEEVWTDLDAAEDILRAGQKAERARVRCVVLELSDDEKGSRGMAICLGRHCQGVVRVGERFAAERWLWEDGEWQRKYRVGELSIPGPEYMDRDTLSLAEDVILQDAAQRWTVVEVSHL